jgi:hypothetical protein
VFLVTLLKILLLPVVPGSGIVSRSTTVEYSTDGKFPVKTSNALGYSETKTFDTKTGNVLT